MKDKVIHNDDTRQFEIELELEHAPEKVWQTIADAEEVTRWFPMHAEVDPKTGGRVLWAWIEPWQFDQKIEIWEPPHHLTLSETRDQQPKPMKVSMDIHLTASEKGTKLRLVHSGFGRGADWDDEFNGISQGWRFELANLKRYLDHHQGQERYYAIVAQRSSLSQAQIFARLLSAQAFAAQQNLATLSQGDTYHLQDPHGQGYQGQVTSDALPVEFAGTVNRLDGGVLRLQAEDGHASVSLQAWGHKHQEAVKAFEKQWRQAFQTLFPAEVQQ